MRPCHIRGTAVMRPFGRCFADAQPLQQPSHSPLYSSYGTILCTILQPRYYTTQAPPPVSSGYSASLIDLIGPDAPALLVPAAPPQLGAAAAAALPTAEAEAEAEAASGTLSSEEARARLQGVRQQVEELEGSLQARARMLACTCVCARAHAGQARVRVCKRACTCARMLAERGRGRGL
jgi:hypothetical protein